MQKLTVMFAILALMLAPMSVMAQDDSGAAGSSDGAIAGGPTGIDRVGPRMAARGVAVGDEGTYKIMAVHLLRTQGDDEHILPVEPQEHMLDGEEPGTVDPDVSIMPVPMPPRPKPDGIFRFGSQVYAITNLQIEVGEGDDEASTGGGPGLIQSFTGELKLIRDFGADPQPMPMPIVDADEPVSSDEDGEAEEPNDVVAPPVDEAVGQISGKIVMADAAPNREVPVLEGEATVDGATYRLLGRVTPVRSIKDRVRKQKRIRKRIRERIQKRVKEMRQKREKKMKDEAEEDIPEGDADVDEEQEEVVDTVDEGF